MWVCLSASMWSGVQVVVPPPLWLWTRRTPVAGYPSRLGAFGNAEAQTSMAVNLQTFLSCSFPVCLPVTLSSPASPVSLHHIIGPTQPRRGYSILVHTAPASTCIPRHHTCLHSLNPGNFPPAHSTDQSSPRPLRLSPFIPPLTHYHNTAIKLLPYAASLFKDQCLPDRHSHQDTLPLVL